MEGSTGSAYSRHMDDGGQMSGIGPVSTFQRDDRPLSPRSRQASEAMPRAENMAQPAEGAAGNVARAAGGPDAANPRPLLQRAVSGRVAAGPHRQVHENAIADASDVVARSPLVMSIITLLHLTEIAIASLCLAKGWDEGCDKPLGTWIVVWTCRLVIFIPLTWWRFILAKRAARDQAAGRFVPEEGTPDQIRARRYDRWMNTLSLCAMILVHFWYWESDACSPWLRKYVLAQIIIFYIRLCLPVFLLLSICLCLPCALILFHILAPRPGAAPEVISNLPTRKISRAPGAPPPADSESCSICMADYEDGEELRVLPCRHEFHSSCVDVWLRQNPTCPLCRKNVASEPEDDDQAHNQV